MELQLIPARWKGKDFIRLEVSGQPAGEVNLPAGVSGQH